MTGSNERHQVVDTLKLKPGIVCCGMCLRSLQEALAAHAAGTLKQGTIQSSQRPGSSASVSAEAGSKPQSSSASSTAASLSLLWQLLVTGLAAAVLVMQL
jgi:hypothetical protein